MHRHAVLERRHLLGEPVADLVAQSRDPGREGPPRGVVQARGFFHGDACREQERRQARGVEDLIRERVADAVEGPRIGEGALQRVRLRRERRAKRRQVRREHVEPAGIVPRERRGTVDQVQ